MATSYQSRLGTAPAEAIKAPCVAATTANITLSGEQTIDGVSVVAGNRVLVRLQTDSTENGIYDCAVSAWTRSTDWNAADDVIAGQLVFDSNDGILYQAVFSGDYTPDTTSLTFKTYNSNMYLGPFAAEPSLDNDGNALVAGQMYYNTVSSLMFVYSSGSTWDLLYEGFDDKYLGSFATAPTEDNDGNALTAGLLYFDTAVSKMYVYSGSAWQISTATAADVALVDAGGKYASDNVEDAFAELASTSTGEGASIIGIEDAGSYYTATNVEAAMQEAGVTTNQFRPHEQSTPDMTVRLEAGKIQYSTALTSVAAQSTGTITAPATNPRIDRVVVDKITGAVSVIGGTEAASPVAPDLTAGKISVAQVALTTSTTTITNSIITDERALIKTTGPISALVYLSANFAVGYGSPYYVGFDSEDHDDAGFHDTVTNNSRLTVPSGVKRVIVKAGYDWDATIGGVTKQAIILKNRAGYVGLTKESRNVPGSGADYCAGCITTPVLNVVAGDYFELNVYHDMGAPIDMIANSTWLSIEAVG